MNDEMSDQNKEEGWGHKILKAVIGSAGEASNDEQAVPPEPVTATSIETPQVNASSVTGLNPQVDTLINLIRELPPEVNRKTGAAIVRKTMAAMGVSVEEVLGDTTRVKASLMKEIELHRHAIEDNKKQIGQMEAAIESSQKKMCQLDEILEIFK